MKSSTTTPVVITVANIVQLAQEEFRSYGFRAETPSISQRNGYVTISWERERATGQASFSQKDVQCSVRLYVPVTGSTTGAGTTVKMNPWDIYGLPLDLAAEEDWKMSMLAYGVDLSVDYNHWGHSSNGKSRDFWVQRTVEKPNAGQLRLVAREKE
jgi:hypothetical protein